MPLLQNVKIRMGTRMSPPLSDHLRYRWSSVPLGGHCHADSGGPSEGPPMKKEHKVSIAVMAFILLAIIGIATGCGKTTPTGNTSPIASGSLFASPVGSPSVTAAPASKAKAKAKAKARAKAKPRRTVAPTAAAPVKSKAPAPPPPPPTTAPAAAPSTPTGCHPLTDGGNCYEPGEYCRDDDHGVSGVAGDGEAITCEDNDGWRWEPA